MADVKAVELEGTFVYGELRSVYVGQAEFEVCTDESAYLKGPLWGTELEGRRVRVTLEVLDA